MNIESRSEELCGGHEKPGKIEREILKLWNLGTQQPKDNFFVSHKLKLKQKYISK